MSGIRERRNRMYCILVTGIPAAGKSTIAEKLSKKFCLPWFSKDSIKEITFDEIGFQSRAEKVKLGVASMNIMYYMAEQLMKCNQPFILENNFEAISKPRLLEILDKYGYTAITISLTGDYATIYQRFIERNHSPERHPGHVSNTCYPLNGAKLVYNNLSYEGCVEAVESREMDKFCANGPMLSIDTTDYSKMNLEEIYQKVETMIKEIKEC